MITNFYKPFSHPLDWWDEGYRQDSEEYDEDLEDFDFPPDPQDFIPESWLVK